MSKTGTSFYSLLASIFCLGDAEFSGLVHQFDLLKRTTRTPTNLVEPVKSTSAAASSHEIIVSGGVNKSRLNVDTCSIYVPATNSWTSLRPLRQARRSHRMCWLPDGRVFAIGGVNRAVLSSVEMLERAWTPVPWEEASAVWKNVATMLTGRRDFGCCIVEERILVAGGIPDGEKPSLFGESFVLPTATNSGQWTSLTDLASGVSNCFLAPSANELILIDLKSSSGVQLGRRKAQVSSSEWNPWIWESRLEVKSFVQCYGMASLPSPVASQR